MRIIFQHSDQDAEAGIYQVVSVSQVESMWSELEAATDTNFFQSWSWISSWLELILPVTKVYLYCYSIAQCPKALCFFTLCKVSRKKGLIRVTQLQLNGFLKSPYNMVAGYNGILAFDEFKFRAWKGFLSCILEFNESWDECFFTSLPDPDLSSLRDAAESLRIDKKFLFSLDVERRCYKWEKQLPAGEITSEYFIDTFKRKSRQQLRQTIKAFSDLGKPNLLIPSSIDEALGLFDEMENTHTQRWRAAGEEGSYANPVWTKFHRGLIEKNFNKGFIQIIQLSVGKIVVGYLYGHVYRNRVYMHQTGFPQLSDNRLRAGYFSHYFAMLYNQQRGLIGYDFLPDFSESYKKFFVDAGGDVQGLTLKRRRLVYRFESLVEKLKRLIESLFLGRR